MYFDKTEVLQCLIMLNRIVASILEGLLNLAVCVDMHGKVNFSILKGILFQYQIEKGDALHYNRHKLTWGKM